MQIQLWLSYIRYAIRYRQWPGRIQRLYMQGDPTGEVKALADSIFREIREIEENDQ